MCDYFKVRNLDDESEPWGHRVLITDMVEKEVPHDSTTNTDRWSYRFTCPKCGSINSWERWGSPFKKTYCISCRTEYERKGDTWQLLDSSN
jgi:hypothetical protein